MNEDTKNRAFEIAYALMRLGVSKSGVERLTSEYPYDLIEQQLKYLPFRKARRPEAMIIQSIRRNYSAPKDYFYAPNQAQPSQGNPLDEGAKLPD